MNAENPSSSHAAPEQSGRELHIPVLLEETVDALRPRPGGRYLDGTLGLGGHSFAILSRAAGQSGQGEQAELCGLDRDTQALALAAERLRPFGDKVHLAHCRYSEFALELDKLGWDLLDGALIDIGVSSLQIDTPERGFSFLANGPLDMRMDRDSGDAPVSRLVNRAGFEQLKEIIERYGEDPQAGRIARTIVEGRVQKPIETTAELAALVERAYPAAWRAKARNHPATRTFQALRMAANDELGELERFLDGILTRLAPGGRVAVISFHSLEDRVVKHKMRAWAQGCVCPKHLPACVCGHSPEARLITVKPIVAEPAETAKNPRAASAKLRVAEKLAPGEAETEGPGDVSGGSGKDRYEAKVAARRARREAAGEQAGRVRRGGAR